MLISRLASSVASALGVTGVSPPLGGITARLGPNPSLKRISDSMSRYVVGNHTGPRQFEFAPFIRSMDSEGSYRRVTSPTWKGGSRWNFDRLRGPAGDRNAAGSSNRAMMREKRW